MACCGDVPAAGKLIAAEPTSGCIELLIGDTFFRELYLEFLCDPLDTENFTLFVDVYKNPYSDPTIQFSTATNTIYVSTDQPGYFVLAMGADATCLLAPGKYTARIYVEGPNDLIKTLDKRCWIHKTVA